MFSREFALCLSINYAHICAWIGRGLKKFSGARSRDLIEQTKQISRKGLFDIGFWESKWISAILMVCAAVLNESETPLKRNPVLTIYISSSNAILLLLSSWFTTVAGPSSRFMTSHPVAGLLLCFRAKHIDGRPMLFGFLVIFTHRLTELCILNAENIKKVYSRPFKQMSWPNKEVLVLF